MGKTFKSSLFEVSTEDVEEYKFQSFSAQSLSEMSKLESIKYDFQDLKGLSPVHSDIHKKKIHLEKEAARKSNFILSPIVREHRRINHLEEHEKETRIAEEVARRVKLVEEEAFQKGYEDGLMRGKEDIYNQTRVETEEKLSILSSMVESALSRQGEIFHNQKMQIYEMIRNLTKWIILRELKEDGAYINRLLERLVTEIGTKDNLLIQVNKSLFERMPEVLEVVEEKIGKLKNVRVEIDFDISTEGIVIESENGIVKGTIEEQFKSLEKLFESVGLNE